MIDFGTLLVHSFATLTRLFGENNFYISHLECSIDTLFPCTLKANEKSTWLYSGNSK